MRAAAKPTRVRLLSRPVCNCAVRASTSTKGVGEGQRWRVEISPIARVTSPSVSPFSSACASDPERASRDRAPGFRFGAWHPDWMLLRDALGACIRRARLDRGRSLREVAEQAGVSLSHLSADNMPDG